jgi:hypothetical protein
VRARALSQCTYSNAKVVVEKVSFRENPQLKGTTSRD